MLLGYCAYYVMECTVNPLPVTQEAADLAFQNLQVSKDRYVVTINFITPHRMATGLSSLIF